METKRLVQRYGVVAAAAVAIFAVAMLGSTSPAEAGRPIKSIAADFDFFGLFEEALTTSETSAVTGVGVPPVISSSSNDGDGLKIYEKSFFLTEAANVLYVSMFTTGDTHEGAASCFTCVVTDPFGNRTFCNAGGQGAASCAGGGTVNVPGWITLLKEPQPVEITNCNDGGGGSADCHDNAISYKWCVPIREDSDGVYTVELWMASDTLDKTVFVEEAHFYIDETKIQGENRCVDPTL